LGPAFEYYKYSIGRGPYLLKGITMFSYIFYASAGYCGMNSEEIIHFDTEPSTKELDEIAWQLAIDNASRYGIEASDGFDPEDDSDYTGENVEGWWEPYTEC